MNALCPGFVQTDLFSSIKSKLGQFSNLADANQELIEKLGVLTWVSKIVQSLKMSVHIALCLQEYFAVDMNIHGNCISWCRLAEVVEGFLELVTDETKNGEALLVLPKEKRYVTFPASPTD